MGLKRLYERHCVLVVDTTFVGPYITSTEHDRSKLTNLTNDLLDNNIL